MLSIIIKLVREGVKKKYCFFLIFFICISKDPEWSKKYDFDKKKSQKYEIFPTIPLDLYDANRPK